MFYWFGPRIVKYEVLTYIFNWAIHLWARSYHITCIQNSCENHILLLNIRSLLTIALELWIRTPDRYNSVIPKRALNAWTVI